MKPVSYISGATGYLGIKITAHLASQGKNLLLSARNGKKLQEIVTNFSKQYPCQMFLGFTCNLEDSLAWQPAVEILNDFSVNEYINCSGIQGQLGPSTELTYQEMSAVFNVNLFSSIFFTNHFVNMKREIDKLSIIHFSGGGSTSPRPMFMSYSLSKTSLLRFIENFAAENPTNRVKINAIAPGVIPSKMQAEVVESPSLRQTKDYVISLKSLSEKNYDTTKVLSLCDFLLTDSSEGITGKLISAEWDNWAEWPHHLEQLKDSDLYTLRRITARDRGQEWGDL
jgi:3-oxoacyl-[acyl-carrier protein] reductase